MTRLNSTFRSGCKLNNRTIKKERKAGQAHKLRSFSRFLSRRNRVFIDIDKTLVRTCKLFRTTLHERLKRTSRATSVKAIRAMDVARQSSMEEGLQVQLLSWKENPDNLISDKLKERCGFDDEILLSRVREDRQSSNGVESDAQAKFRSQQDEEALEKLNGVGKIEACVRSENRMQENAKPAEKTLNDVGCISHTGHTGADSIFQRNGIATDDMHLNRSLDLQESVPIAISEPEDLSTISSTGNKVERSDICLKGVQSTFGISLNQSPLADTKDEYIVNVEENRTTMDNIDVKSIPTNNPFKENDRDNKYKSMQRFETNLFGDNSRLFSQASNIDIDSVNGSYLNNGTVTTNECKNEYTIEGQNCLCEGIDGVASFTSVGTAVGRPKRTTRQLRPRHEDDYILDVRQIPHKFNDKISSVKKGNKRTLLSGFKRRRKTMKNSSCENVQGVMDTSEKVNTRVKDDDEEKYSNVDCVLGVRHDDCNRQQVLVQFTDGTSNWIKKSEVTSPVDFLCEYFSHPDQDIVAAQRLPAHWFGYELASWEDRPLEEADFGDFDFFKKEDKVSRDCKTRKGYSSSKQSSRSSQNLLSVSCKYVVEGDDRLVTPTDEQIYSAELFSSKINENPSLDNYPSIPLSLDSLTKNGDCNLNDLDYMFVDSDLTENELIGSKVTEESPHLQKIFNYGDNTTSSPDAVPMFVSRNGELEVLKSDHVEIILKHKDKRSKRIRSETCDNLIHQLESRINDDKCQFVVINGLEDYFASSMDMEKLIKFPCEAEKTRYDEKMANLRYLFQTLKNYPKPVVAVINSAATGLAASLLSLVDVVYDQSADKIKKNGIFSKPYLPVLAPKLMGLQHKNEALLMGEFPDNHLEEQLKKVNNIMKSFRFSDGITSTLKEMRLNEKLSSERPNLKRRGRPSMSKNSPILSIEPHHSSYNKTRLARLRCPTAFDEADSEGSDEDKALKSEIVKEQELASQCLKELNEFWKEIAESSCTL